MKLFLKTRRLGFTIIFVSFFWVIQSQGSQIYFESEPVSLIYEGYQLRISRSSTFSKNLSFGIGYLKLKLPDEMSPVNKGEGWTAQLGNGYDIFMDYHFSNPDKGWFTGVQASIYELSISRNAQNQQFKTLVGVFRVGYLWRPFSNAFYLMPWLGLITQKRFAGEDTIGDQTYDFEPLATFPSISFGVSF